jgi:lipoprotein-releasing system permease protein
MISVTNLKIAFTHLSSRLKQTLVATLSVTFGIGMYIFMNSFMNGVNQVQADLAFSTLAHIHICNDVPEDNTDLLKKSAAENEVINIRNTKIIQYTDGIKNSENILKLLAKYPQITGAAPEVNINVFFRNGASKVNGLLSGVDVDKENSLFKTSDYITQGNWTELNYRSDGVIVGAGLAYKMSLKLNDNLVVSTADGVTKSFKIIGIFKTTLAGVDNSKAYIKIGTARQLLSENQSYVTDIQINISDYNSARDLAAELSPQIPYKVEAWQIANGQLEAASELRNIIALAVSLTILIVAGFGIYNIMNMTVNEKIKEIAILKAMGFQGNDIVQIFLTQSIVIGIFGGLLGMLLGLWVAEIVNHIPFHIATLESLPMTYYSKDYILSFVFGMITTFIAGYLPAIKASSIDPVSIIRN